MALARSVLERLKSSDGRIRVKTLSGVSVLVAAIALLVGVLPVFAYHSTSKVQPAEIGFGGGAGGCDAVESVADNQLHINNPSSGKFTGPDGTEIEITVDGRVFQFVTPPGIAVYNVTVNGGSKSNHYDYINGPFNGPNEGPAKSDKDLHAPRNPQGTPHNLSHINICYDFDTQFECGVTETREPDDDGVFTVAQVTIFANLLWSCEDKLGAFTVDNDTESADPDPSVLVNFGTGNGVVAGMATFTKDFGEGMPPFKALQYSLTADSKSVDVSWCNIRAEDSKDLVTINNGNDPVNPFATWLPEGKYPSLAEVTDEHTGALGDAIACKVYEEEDASGIQFTVVYFEFEDPNFR